jgi:hypothetical protein
MQKEMPGFTVLKCSGCGGKIAFKMPPELALVSFASTGHMCHNCLEKEANKNEHEKLLYDIHLREVRMACLG